MVEYLQCDLIVFHFNIPLLTVLPKIPHCVDGQPLVLAGPERNAWVE